MILQYYQYVCDNKVKLLITQFLKDIIHQWYVTHEKSYRGKILLFQWNKCDYGEDWMNNNIPQLPNMAYVISYRGKYLLFQWFVCDSDMAMWMHFINESVPHYLNMAQDNCDGRIWIDQWFSFIKNLFSFHV